jgi:transposase, IS6 family
VRWYCKYGIYGISYRDLEEMMGERGVSVDHSTFYRWVQHYARELQKRTLWYQKPDQLLVAGRRKYLYRAINKGGALLDFSLADRRNAKAACAKTDRQVKRFLAKALHCRRDWSRTSLIPTRLPP